MSNYRIPRKVKKTMPGADVAFKKHLELLVSEGCLNGFKLKVRKGRLNVSVFPKTCPEFIDVTICKSLLS